MSFNQAPFTPVQDFVYQNMIAPEAGVDVPLDRSIFGEDAQGTPAQGENSGPNVSALEMRRREQVAYQQGLAAGRDEMRAQADQAVEQASSQARQMVAESLQKFAEDRQQYYRRVEGEVVDLVLAIARKVLYREAQVDRVVLGGVVRVALEKIAGGSQVSLHVHPTAVKAWREYIAAQAGWATIPEVVEDNSLATDRIVLKTTHGNTELGIDAQLNEIEKGFADMVRQKQRSVR
jgi:flagellar assembly protein FliH